MPPKHRGSLKEDIQFGDDEKLFRRIPVGAIKPDGSVDPAAIQSSCSFDKTDKQKTPSVVREGPRGIYASWEDALHPDCGCRNPTDIAVCYCVVGDLPKGEHSQKGAKYDFIPIHDPLEACYAHSLIRSIFSGAEAENYSHPPKDVRTAFRIRFAQSLKRVST